MKDPNAVALGKKGGMARAAQLSKAKRKEIANLGAAKRWEGHVVTKPRKRKPHA